MCAAFQQYEPPTDDSVRPAPPAKDYTYPAFGSHDFTEPPGPKKRPRLTVGLLVVGVLLAVGGCAVAGAIFYLSSGDANTPDEIIVDAPMLDDERVDTEDFDLDSLEPDPVADAARIAEWQAWAPAVIEMLPATPEDKLDLVEQGLAIVLPDLTYAESVMWTGYYSEVDDWYYSDMMLVRATRRPGDDISAVVELYIQSDLMVADGIPFEPDVYDIVTTIGDGQRELLYQESWGSSRYPLTSGLGVALWKTIEADWPGAVVYRFVDYQDDDRYVEVQLTKWELYAIADYSPHVVMTYGLRDDEWLLVEWEYVLPDEAAEDPDDVI